jgi:hypothetical protein
MSSNRPVEDWYRASNVNYVTDTRPRHTWYRASNVKGLVSVPGRDSRIDLETRDHQLENKFGASKCLNLGSITALGLCPLSRHFSDSAHDITRVGVIIMGHHA